MEDNYEGVQIEKKEDIIEELEEKNETPQTEFDVEDLDKDSYNVRQEAPNMDGQIKIIKAIKLVNTFKDQTTKAGDKKYRGWLLKIIFDDDTWTNYSGIKQYYANDNKTLQKSLNIWKNGTSEIAKLYKIVCKHNKVYADDVGELEFFKMLKGLKIKLKHKIIEVSGKEFGKNYIDEILGGDEQ